VLLLVLIMVGALFVVGLGAVNAVTRDTASGQNFAAYAVALQAAQSGVEVAKRRLDHPWDVGLDHGQNWGGTGGYVSLPTPGDGDGALMDAYYRIDVSTSGNLHTVTVTGRAVRPGGNVNSADDVLAARTVRAVMERPNIRISYAILAAGDLRLPSKVTVNGSVHANGNVIVDSGAAVNGNITATGTITVNGVCNGTRTPGATKVFIPKIVYYGYRPNYDYNGLDNSATQLGTNVVSAALPTGVSGNPNNIYYSNQSELYITTGVNLNSHTIVAMYDLIIIGAVTIKATAGFPSAIINDDLIITNGSTLTTEGMLELRDDVMGSNGNAQAPTAVWNHRGPILFESSGSISTNFKGTVTIDYRADRVAYQPVGSIVLPIKVLSYTENP
jgi:hypothetical protein